MRSNVVLPHPEGPSSTRNSPSRIERSTSSTRSEEHTSELQSPCNLVCRLLLEKKKTNTPVRFADLREIEGRHTILCQIQYHVNPLSAWTDARFHAVHHVRSTSIRHSCVVSQSV